MHGICTTIKVCYRCALVQQSVALGYLSGHFLLQKPFRTEAPLLMEIFQQVFKGATAAELAEATAPVAAQRQPGQSRRANIVRPKGDAQGICCCHAASIAWCTALYSLGAHNSHCVHPSVKQTTTAAYDVNLHHRCCAVAHRPLCVKQTKGTCLPLCASEADVQYQGLKHCSQQVEASATHKPKIAWAGSGMANERAAMERQKQKLRQACAGAPARHARFGGLFVRRYNAEDRGCVVRSNPLASHLPALPEPKKTSKIMVGSWSPYSCLALMLLSRACVHQCC